LIYGDYKKEISSGFRLTTNNRMELLAPIEALSLIKKAGNYDITIYSDSRLLVDTVNKGWLKRWENNNWMRNKKEKAKNIDLLERLSDLLKIHNVKFVWVKAHAGNELNERCDFLCKQAATGNNLAEDIGYERAGEE
jgi:ribonuclease HI